MVIGGALGKFRWLMDGMDMEVVGGSNFNPKKSSTTKVNIKKALGI